MIPLSNYSIKTFCGGYDQNYTYLITCSHTGTQILIDASKGIKEIKPHIYSKITAVLITHSHHDHIHHVDQYLNHYPDLIIYGYKDLKEMFKKNVYPLKDNLEFKIGRLVIKSIYTPGHYFDSICYQINPILFTGDTMFVGRTGRVVSKKSNIKDLYNSIYHKILKMPLKTRIFPGHNYGKHPTISLEKNIKISPLLQAESFDDFVERMKKFELSRKL